MAYGGARGGGKSWAARMLAAYSCLVMPGLSALMMRRKYLEVEENHILPLRALLPESVARYHAASRSFLFCNGSRIRMGHLNNDADINEYQGLEFNMLFIDEATQFTENEFRMLCACLRGVNRFPKRAYLTCNPGGIGHAWVKRLFVSKDYQAGEDAADYTFIPATVDDNAALMRCAPDYVRMLDLLPEDIRRAHRYGDWDALSGQYFSEFKTGVHTCAPFVIPEDWMRYRAIDYGLDMLACLWIALDYDGRAWIYRELMKPGLIVSEAAALIDRMTLPYEKIAFTIAPPDLWSTQKDTGRTMAEIFMQSGIGLVRGSAARTQGWLSVKEYLKIRGDGRPGLIVFSDQKNLISSLNQLQHDKDNPGDCATQPHGITHITDALRYFCHQRTLYPARAGQAQRINNGYDALMTGAGAPRAYIEL